MALSPLSSQPVADVDLTPLAALVAKAFPEAGSRPFFCVPMPGGASTRRYYRVTSAPRPAVGMFVPDGLKPEEIAKGAHEGGRWPFLEVRDLLASPEAQARLADLPPGCVVASRAFDEELLAWEMQHFREWALEARGIRPAPPDRAAFDGLVQRLAARIASWPRTFVHRDYQSRNLMVRPDETLCWIDFQDALLGPRVYDLVALLNDSYQSLDRPFVEARLADYARAARLGEGERAEVVRQFDLVTVQRKLKDAGRFVFIDRVKGNPGFLRFVEPTIAKVRASLGRLTDDADMRELSALLTRTLPA